MQNKNSKAKNAAAKNATTNADAAQADARLEAIKAQPERTVNASEEQMQQAVNSGMLTDATPAEIGAEVETAITATDEVTAQLALTDAAQAEDKSEAAPTLTVSECIKAKRDAAEKSERAARLNEQAVNLTAKAAAETDKEKAEKISRQAAAAADEAATLADESDALMMQAEASEATYTPAVLDALTAYEATAATARELSRKAKEVMQQPGSDEKQTHLTELHTAAQKARAEANAAKAAQAEAEATRDGAHDEYRRDKAERPDMAEVSKDKWSNAQADAVKAKVKAEDTERAADAAESLYSKAAAKVDEAQKRAEAAHNEAAEALDRVKDAYTAQIKAQQEEAAAALILANLKEIMPNLSKEGAAFAARLARPAVAGNAQARTDALSGAIYSAVREVLRVYQAVIPDNRTTKVEMVIGHGRDADAYAGHAALDNLTERETEVVKGKAKPVPAFGRDSNGKAVKRADWKPERETIYAGLKVSTRHMDAGALSRTVSSERGQYAQAKAALKAETDRAEAIEADAPRLKISTTDAPAPFGAVAVADAAPIEATASNA